VAFLLILLLFLLSIINTHTWRTKPRRFNWSLHHHITVRKCWDANCYEVSGFHWIEAVSDLMANASSMTARLNTNGRGYAKEPTKGPSPLHSDFRFRMPTHCSLFASKRSQIVSERSYLKLMHSDVLFLSEQLHANQKLPNEISQSRFNSHWLETRVKVFSWD